MTQHRKARRDFLRAASAFSAGTLGVPFGLNLATMSAASAQTAGVADYKALVCLFLVGGNDAANMVLPTDTDSWTRYIATRNQGSDPIALRAVGTAVDAVAAAASPARLGGVLPIVPTTAQYVPGTSTVRTFALHPLLTDVQSLFGAGRLAVLANVGTLIQPTTKAQYKARSVPLPTSLFSHNDQQSTWQAGATEGARVGWGGRMGDLWLSENGSAGAFTAISTSGNAVWLSGQSVVQYQVTNSGPVKMNGLTGSLFGSSTAAATLASLVTDTQASAIFARDYATVVKRSLDAQSVLSAAFASAEATAVAAPTQYTNPVTGTLTTNGIATQLQTVARMIAARNTLGLKRQVFFVSVGGFDTHDAQNRGQADLLARLGHALAYFDGALAAIAGDGGNANIRDKVTLFTASDFGRTYTTNGDGTDHGWGGHHFILGGAVKGKNFYGQYPTVGVSGSPAGFENPDEIGSGTLLPTTSVEQYAATLGSWFGISDTNLASLFPNLANFSTRNLGFMNAG